VPAGIERGSNERVTHEVVPNDTTHTKEQLTSNFADRQRSVDLQCVSPQRTPMDTFSNTLVTYLADYVVDELQLNSFRKSQSLLATPMRKMLTRNADVAHNSLYNRVAPKANPYRTINKSS